MHTSISRAALALAFISAPGLAVAQQTGGDDIIVTATRATEGVALDETGSSVTVISAQDMQDRQVRYIYDVLRDVPGISVSPSDGRSGLAQVRIRGAEANHTLFLIDGVEASDPFQGEFDFATLISDDVAKIEVVRGAQSALYGSDALAGVINYITLSGAERPGLSARAEGGSFGTFETAARWGSVAGALDYVINGAYQTTDGFPTATVGTRDVGSEHQAYSARLGYKLSDSFKLRASVRYSHTDADTNDQDFLTGFIVDSPGSGYEAKSLYWVGGGDLSLLGGAWTHSLTVQGVNAERDSFAFGARSGGDKGERVKGSYVTTYVVESGARKHAFTGALDWERETYQNTSPPSLFGPDTTKRHVDNIGAVAQYDLTIGEKAGFGAAVRQDQNERFDDATTFRVNGYYRVAEQIRVRAAAGSGIKNPGETELFGFNAAAFPFVGNPSLKPEKSTGWEVGADVYLNDNATVLGVTYFDAKLKDEILDDFSVFPSTTGNRDTESTQKGVELSAKLKLDPSWTVDASYTYLDAKENGTEEIRRPPNVGSVVVNWRGTESRFGANLAVRYNGDTTDQDFSTFPATTVTLKSFTLVTLGGSFDLTDKLQAYARVENALDEDYQDVFRYRTSGRAGYVGVRAAF